jgi:glutamate racemase
MICQNSKIGVFDSGSGGLTVLKELRVQMPTADFLYFGDIKNAPYGQKSQTELFALTEQALAFLHAHGAQHIVSACNSVSTSLVRSKLNLHDIVEMTGPTAEHFRGSSARILLAATPATIDSGIYQEAFAAVQKEIETLAIPELAGAIEFGGSEQEIEHIIKSSLETVSSSDFDTLVLACTHYPLVASVFKRAVSEKIAIFDPAAVVASEAVCRFGSSKQGNASLQFFITNDSAPFRALVGCMFDGSIHNVEVVN